MTWTYGVKDWEGEEGCLNVKHRLELPLPQRVYMYKLQAITGVVCAPSRNEDISAEVYESRMDAKANEFVLYRLRLEEFERAQLRRWIATGKLDGEPVMATR